MRKYRKRPIVIHAEQWWPDVKIKGVEVTKDDFGYHARIKTLEGTMFVTQGDWIIKGVEGELYPCKPGIFEKTYEPIE